MVGAQVSGTSLFNILVVHRCSGEHGKARHCARMEIAADYNTVMSALLIKVLYSAFPD